MKKYYLDEETYQNTGELLITDNFSNIVNIFLLDENDIIEGNITGREYKIIQDLNGLHLKELPMTIARRQELEKRKALETNLKFDKGDIKDTFLALSTPLDIEEQDSFYKNKTPDKLSDGTENDIPTLDLERLNNLDINLETTNSSDENNEFESLLSRCAKENYYIKQLKDYGLEKLLNDRNISLNNVEVKINDPDIDDVNIILSCSTSVKTRPYSIINMDINIPFKYIYGYNELLQIMESIDKEIEIRTYHTNSTMYIDNQPNRNKRCYNPTLINKAIENYNYEKRKNTLKGE